MFDKSRANHPSVVEETLWEQRQFFNIVDGISSEIVSIMVQVHNLLGVAIIRLLPVKDHMNATFQIEDRQWQAASWYGWVLVLLNLIIIAWLSTFFRRMKGLNNRKLRMKGVLCYTFRNHFWFLFLWLTATGSYACVNMINHFGADFTLKFAWLQCRESAMMMWPNCRQA